MVEEMGHQQQDEMQSIDAGLRTRVNSLEHSNTLHEQRVAALENWRTHSDIYDARREEQMTSFKRDIEKDMLSLKSDISDVGSDIGEVKGTLQWIGRLIIAGIIAGALAFMLKGGFNIKI